MLALFDYKSKNAVHGLLRKLQDLGYVTITGGKLSFTSKLMGNIKLLGTVQAGFPSPAEEELIDTLSLDDFLIEKPDATYMLKVTGDSMIDAGIHPGDLVIVERDATPRTNDIVIAHVDDEWTMKYFVKKGRNIHLEPANKKYKTIRPKQSLELCGIVRSVIRKYT